MAEPRRDDWETRNSYGKRVLRYLEGHLHLRVGILIIFSILSTILVVGIFPNMFGSTKYPETLFAMMLAAFGVFWFIVLRKIWKRLIKKARQ